MEINPITETLSRHPNLKTYIRTTFADGTWICLLNYKDLTAQTSDPEHLAIDFSDAEGRIDSTMLMDGRIAIIYYAEILIDIVKGRKVIADGGNLICRYVHTDGRVELGCEQCK